MSALTEQQRQRIVDVYLQDDFYNPRIRATVYGAWIAVDEKGRETPICRPWEAKNRAEAFRIAQEAAR